MQNEKPHSLIRFLSNPSRVFKIVISLLVIGLAIIVAYKGIGPYSKKAEVLIDITTNPNKTDTPRPTEPHKLPADENKIAERLKKAYENGEITFFQSASKDRDFKKKLNKNIQDVEYQFESIINTQYDKWAIAIPEHAESYVNRIDVNSLKDALQRDLKINEGVDIINSEMGKVFNAFLKNTFEIRREALLTEIRNLLEKENYSANQITEFLAERGINAEGQEWYRSHKNPEIHEAAKEVKDIASAIKIASVAGSLVYVYLAVQAAFPPAYIAAGAAIAVVALYSYIDSKWDESNDNYKAIQQITETLQAALKEMKTNQTRHWRKRLLEIEKAIDEMFDNFIKNAVFKTPA